MRPVTWPGSQWMSTEFRARRPPNWTRDVLSRQQRHGSPPRCLGRRCVRRTATSSSAMPSLRSSWATLSSSNGSGEAELADLVASDVLSASAGIGQAPSPRGHLAATAGCRRGRDPRRTPRRRAGTPSLMAAMPGPISSIDDSHLGLPERLVQRRERGQADGAHERRNREPDPLHGDQQHERQARRTSGTNRRSARERCRPSIAPANPAMPPESANTATFAIVRLTPMVAEAAGLSDMAIQRRAHRVLRSSCKER